MGTWTRQPYSLVIYDVGLAKQVEAEVLSIITIGWYGLIANLDSLGFKARLPNLVSSSTLSFPPRSLILAFHASEAS
jgi:hypothetical protein